MKRLHKYLSCGYGSLTYTKYKYLPFQSLYRFNSTNLNINSTEDSGKDDKKYSIKDGPGLKDFLMSDAPLKDISIAEENIPYIEESPPSYNRRVFFDVYGCQMNVNDTEVVWSILQKKNFLKVDVVENADVILMITCAIREGAENKIWKRLEYYKALKKRRTKSITPIKVGVLGCMAERLKHKLIEKEKSVDVVAGPDSYKDLPRLLALTENNQYAINVLLSLDETYADVMPVRLNEDSKTAFVSIMRGCDNMCTYCIVPFTRGKERSRPTSSIVDEVKHLSDQGVKEVTLLGQNVNSYRDLSEDDDIAASTNLVKGFKTVYKLKKGGLRFADLLDKISLIDPEMRIRFTSPHPKDFPDEVLQIIKERPNICNSLHLPAQSGSSSVLERMRRGYNREAYLDLIDRVREVLPDVSLSSDFICGFCHESDEEFNDTISLMETVKYNVAFLFPYSMREKTTAHRRYTDDVPDNIKHERLLRMAEVYRRRASEINNLSVGKIQLILIEGISKRSDNMLAGRNDGNIKVIIPKGTVPGMVDSNDFKNISPGDYIVVRIDSATSQTFKGTPLCHSTLQMFANNTRDSYINNLKSIENV